MSDSVSAQDRAVAKWLLICCSLVFVMVILGGVTRLTGSGLSMVDWQPVSRLLPPIGDQEWQKTFAMYQQTPEFQEKNAHMNVHDFKGIFWLEYVHRLLGRMIGMVFFFPFIYFLWRGFIGRDEWPKYTLMFVLGGMQGVLGWYMVKSGLVNVPEVSQYRLTAHLIAAFAIFGYMFWIALSRLYPSRNGGKAHPWFGMTIALTLLIITTIVAGGFVAGLKAGKIYNTFPMMGDYWLPPGMLALDPMWRNLFDNMTTVQFDHRVLAITTFVLVVVYWAKSRKTELPVRARKAVNALLHTATLQVVLGISTLLLIVPVFLAATHQAVAMLLYTVALYLCHSLYQGSDRG